MMYVRKEFVATRRNDFEFDDLELLWVEIKIGTQKIFVGVGYRPPGMTALEIDNFLDLFAQSYELAVSENSEAILILGDFNDRCYTWYDNHADSELGLRFFNYLHDSNLFQLIEEPTRHDRLLDLLITDSPGFIVDHGTLDQIGNIDHRIIFGILRIFNPLPSKLRRTVLNYNKADFEKINNDLVSAPWDLAFYLYDDIDDILNYYYGILNGTIDEHIPKKEIIKRKKDKPWMNGYLRWLIRIRNRWNGTYDRTQREDHKFIRNHYRNLFTREKKFAKRNYYGKLKSNLSSKNITIKKFWSIMKELHGAKIKETIPTLIDEGISYTTDLEKANLFGKFFAETCSLPPPPVNHRLPPITFHTNQRLTTIDFVPHAVREILKHLNVNKASGPDGISYRFLKECAFSLAEPLCRLFNKSMSSNIFPTKWKESHLSPVYKKASKDMKVNYRPVSLLSCISKVMGRVVFDGMYKFFKDNGILTKRNSGLKKKIAP